jgi:predicted MPP superfamily phosphohydrolase
MVYFLVAHLGIYFYLLIRLVLPLRASRAAKSAAALILLLISQHYVVRFAFGALGAPELPRLAIMAEGWCFAALLIMFLLVLALDALTLARRILGRATGEGRRKEKGFSPGRRMALTVLLGAVPAAYAVRKAVAVPLIRTTEARLASLPEELDGLTLVQIADLHISALLQREWAQAVVETANAQHPDLILLNGDMVDGALSRHTDAVAPLGDLRARHGVYACTGNHEYYSGFDAWMERFASLGLTMLLNRHALVPVNGRKIVIAGITDTVARDFGRPPPDLAAALDGAPRGALRILLDHRPGGAPRNAGAGIDLQLSGHTHGGHALGMDRIVARFNGGFVRGWYAVAGMALYVSSGAGLWNGFPVRLGVPSEIVRMTLRRG